MYRVILKIFLAFSMLAAIFSSCTRYYHIEANTFVDSKTIPNGFHPGSSFAIHPFEKEQTFLEKEVSQKIEQILVDKGYHVVPPNKADYYLTFSISMTSSTHIVQVPEYVPGKTKTKKGSYGGIEYEEEITEDGDVIYVPEEQTLYHGELIVIAYDPILYKHSKEDSKIWEGTAINSDENKDLRQVVDYLLVSLFEYFGKGTKRSIEVEIQENSEEVKKLRDQMVGLLRSS
ncbi:hypothetical protein [Candidatus Neptunochlamydia vexilliferae]|uniref:DUF4136 domain-containing protein n=1 Tax=Candidatus Neptunichlamydia vexilliferae TaxID=1651774 RepID=A0ABS0B373_9BACT|nr:hypothetical protein [Candidatus Neptunochlamydia vexilliferae]MBF5060040.1 hypothetical protein [Candidatus Neptunochlamydia vexilliferae]